MKINKVRVTGGMAVKVSLMPLSMGLESEDIISEFENSFGVFLQYFCFCFEKSS